MKIHLQQLKFSNDLRFSNIYINLPEVAVVVEVRVKVEAGFDPKLNIFSTNHKILFKSGNKSFVFFSQTHFRLENLTLIEIITTDIKTELIYESHS